LSRGETWAVANESQEEAALQRQILSRERGWGQGDNNVSKEPDRVLSRGSGGRGLLRPERQGQDHRHVRTGEGGGRRSPWERRFLWRGLSNRSAAAPGDKHRDGGKRDNACQQSERRARAPFGARFCRGVHGVFVGPEREGRGGPGRPAFQFQREASGKIAAIDGEFRQRRTTPGTGTGENQPGDACRDGRHHAVAGECFHEQISGSGLHRVQRRLEGPQFPIEHRPAGLILGLSLIFQNVQY